MNSFVIAFLIMLSGSYLSRRLMNRSLNKLTPEKQLALIEIFNSKNSYQFGVQIGLIILFFLAMRYFPSYHLTNYIVFSGLLFVFILFTSWTAYSKLKKNNFPMSYISDFLISSLIRVTGLILFSIIIITDPAIEL